MKRILVTGAGGSPSTNFIRSLRRLKEKIYIVGLDSSEYYIARSEADLSLLAPSCKDPRYVNFLNYVIQKYKLEFMHVQNDEEVSTVSQLRDKINVNLFLPSKETIEICQNKYKTNKVWGENKLKVPKSFMIYTYKDLQNVYEKLGDKIWLREISGAGGRGSLAPENIKQARTWIDFKEGWGKFVAAELLSPDSITWMSIWHQGKLIVAQGRKRLYWELAKISPSGITGATGGGITTTDPVLDKIAMRAVTSLDTKPHGIFSVDLTYDFKGIPNPTEINIGRFFTTHEFFTQGGINMPEIFIKLAYGEKLPKIKKKLNPLPKDLIWIRGMDFLPVLTTKKKLEANKKALHTILQKLQ